MGDSPAPDIHLLRRRLRAFYRSHARDLPWRRNQDPYRVWVSEIMCQQTQVDTARRRYPQFIARFPTVHALAEAQEAEVCEAWAGLGYYSRARNLWRAAGLIVEKWDGKPPTDVPSLLSLPGIGRYTAGAIASICASAAAPIVDGNVMRLYTRLTAHPQPKDNRELQLEIWSWAAAYVQAKKPGELNQALMEFGALVCTPRAPECHKCSLSSVCRAFAEDNVLAYPRRAAKAVRQLLPMAFVLIETPTGIWLRQRPLQGLWPGLWEPPSATGRRRKHTLQSLLGQSLGRPIARVEHLLSHRRVVADVYALTATASTVRRLPNCCPGQGYTVPEQAALSGLARKVLACAAGKPVARNV